MNNIPVIAIDGPSASGKGTIAEGVARKLGFHYLDSGALYRVVGLAALDTGLLEPSTPLDEAALARLATSLDIRFEDGQVLSAGVLVTDAIRREDVGNAASKVAALPTVRQALLASQRAFRRAPGLVADGRDMGSVVFPDARLKIYLIADAEERARRRYKQLIDKGMSANMAALLQDIKARDARDTERVAAPLLKTDDATVLDSSRLTIGATLEQVLMLYGRVAVSGCVGGNEVK